MDLYREPNGTAHFYEELQTIMSKEKLITRERLMELTREARGDLKQREVAEEFDVTQEAISKAENNAEDSMDGLRKKIVRHYSGIRIEGPVPCFRMVEEGSD